MRSIYYKLSMPLRGLRAGGMALCLGALLATPTPLAAPSTPTKAPELQELLAQARSQSRVPVIVTLAMDDPKTADPAAIQAVQQQLLTELAHFHIENIKTYRYLPMLAFHIEPVGLGYLLGSPLVKTIQLDKSSAIQNSNDSSIDHR